MKKTIAIILLLLIMPFKSNAFLKIISTEINDQSNEIDILNFNRDDPSAYYVDIALITEADCDNIRWTVGGQKHRGILDCDKILIFEGAVAGKTYSTVIEGCGGKFDGYLETGYHDSVFCICPNQLQMNECCPNPKGQNAYYSWALMEYGTTGKYFCDECPYETEPTSTTSATPITTTTIPKYYSISGHVTGDLISNISIHLSGTISKIVMTDTVYGSYVFSGLEIGYYTITPEMKGYSFMPPNYQIQNLNSNLQNMNFVSARVKPVSPCALELIYGEGSDEIRLLKFVRDNILSKTPEGRKIIRLYYEWNSTIIRTIENNSEVEEKIKELINGIIEIN